MRGKDGGVLGGDESFVVSSSEPGMSCHSFVYVLSLRHDERRSKSFESGGGLSGKWIGRRRGCCQLEYVVCLSAEDRPDAAISIFEGSKDVLDARFRLLLR